MLALGDQELDRFATVLRRDLDPALVLVVATEFDAAVHLGDDRAVLGATGFEQFGHPRQTAGDVTGLGAFRRDPRQHVAGSDLVAVADREDGPHGQQVTGFAAVGQAFIGAVGVEHGHGRTQVSPTGAGAPVDDHAVGDAGGFIGLFAHGQAFDQVFEADLAAHLGKDGGRVGIPLGDAAALLDHFAVLDPQTGAIGRLVGLAILAIDLDHDLGVAAHHHKQPIGGLDGGSGDLSHPVIGAFKERLLGDLGRAADVEGAHGQLSAGLTDRLGGDDAHRFADVHLGATGQVTAVAGGADTGGRFASQRGADLHRLGA